MANHDDDVIGEPLPKDFTHTSLTILSAHDRCRDLEENLLSALKDDMSKAEGVVLNKELINVRILGHLLTVAPSERGKAYVAREILLCKTNDDLVDAGEFYDKHLLRIFRRTRGHTPASSRDDSRTCFDRIEDMIEQELVATLVDHRQAKQNALIRDSYRCPLSRSIDQTSVMKIKELNEQAKQNISSRAAVTKCAHIFPESTITNLDNADKSRYAGNAWAILQAFGYDTIRNDLDGANIHSLKNVLTLDVSLHTLFDDLVLWLEPTTTNHRYRVGVSEPAAIMNWGIPEFVELTSSSPELELPSSTYLGIHAACCRVAHMSGASEYFHKMLDRDNLQSNYDPRDTEDFAGVLAARLYDFSEQNGGP